MQKMRMFVVRQSMTDNTLNNNSDHLPDNLPCSVRYPKKLNCSAVDQIVTVVMERHYYMVWR